MKLSLKISKLDLSKITDEVKQKAFGKEQMKAFMEKLIVDIKKRTRMGYGVSVDFKPKEKLEKLSKAYRKFREENPYGELSEFTNANRSGLTYSGQMLDAMEASSEGQLRGAISLKDARKRVRKQKKTPTNNQLADWHEQGAGKLPKRPFMHISDMEYKRIVQDMQKQLNQVLKRIKL